MPGSKISLIGSSNRQTNDTGVFGNMPGLAPTATVRPSVSGINGYKHLKVAANGFIWSDNTKLDSLALGNGCGLGKNSANGKSCLEHLKLYNGVYLRHDPVRSRSILG